MWSERVLTCVKIMQASGVPLLSKRNYVIRDASDVCFRNNNRRLPDAGDVQLTDYDNRRQLGNVADPRARSRIICRYSGRSVLLVGQWSERSLIRRRRLRDVT